MVQQRYEYPDKVDKENLEILIERAKEITNKSRIAFGVSVVLSFVLIAMSIVYFSPLFDLIPDRQTFAYVTLSISFGASIFVSGFLIDFLNVFIVRRILTNVAKYPSSEEYVFANCVLTATLFERFPKSDWARQIRFKSLYLSEEFSRFTKYDVMNFRRKVYANEFRLLGSGETEIARMLMFSKVDKKKLLTDFAMSLVNQDDPEAFRFLKRIVDEIEKFGKLENRTQRIENKLKKWKNVLAIIGGSITIIATIIGLIIH